MKTNVFRLLCFLALPALLLLSSCNKYKYETVPGDPMKTRIYTLDNGLKVYLSVNPDAPRIQTVIAVNAGGKNDPAETTGLAHYFEHLMFKGTSSFGSVNYEEEKVYLDRIEELFETYRKTTDPAERTRIYAEIDSVSQVASKYAIPNEYDKLMAAIGAQGTNAFTSNDITAYVEDIPANQIENWAKIQADRFQDPVIRLFHTELETVYEEYNMGKASDMRQVFAKILEDLFPHHPYGTQTVIGTPEQLKNPSITNIKNFFAQYYVPNNMAVIMAGDFDPDKTIAIIDKYFGKMEPKEVPEFTYEEEKPLEENIIDTVVGINPAMLAMVYPLPSPRNEEMAIAELVATVLTNDKTGLIDVNLNQAQKVMYAGSYYMSLADYGVMELVGMPRQGQSLEEVRDLLLEQVEKLKKGEFDEAMLKATLANFEVEQYQDLRNNNNRAMMMMDAFNQHDDWANVVSRLERLSKVTKQQVVDFANKYLNHYALIYKLEGAPNFERIEKPQITPLSINRDTTSAYLTDVRNARPADLTPRFVDFNKDLTVSKFENKLELLYKKNDADPLFSLYYVYEMGSFNDKELDLAFQYIPYLGTDKYTAEELQNELYKLAADYRTVASNERVYVYLTGIDKNFEASVELFEHILSSVKADPERYVNLAMDYIKGLDDSKKQQNANLKQLINYTVYGPVNPATYKLSAQEVMEMNPEQLTDKFKNLRNYEHTIMYFGPRSLSAMNKVLVAHHTLPETFLPMPEAYNFTYRENEGKVFFAPYEAPQVNVVNLMVSVPYEKEIEVAADMYNSYFGGGMSGIVFQEIREARALAYSAYAFVATPSRPDKNFIFHAFVGTQTDKMKDALKAMDEITQDMPMSQQTFELAKTNVLDGYRSDRCLRENIFFRYLYARQMGFEGDPKEYYYNKSLNITLDDVKAYQEEYIKGKRYNSAVLGNPKDVDMQYLKTMGELTVLTPQDIFGY